MLLKSKLLPAHDDIQKGIDYYNEEQKGLGKRFHKQVKSCIASIKKNPYFQIRYEEVRCLPVRSFPFMIHFTVNEEDSMATIYAVINTSLNPDAYWVKS